MKGTFSIQTLLNILSAGITIFCIGFVIYKAEECFDKFLKKPESTDVSIAHAYKHPYPAISICLDYNVDLYNKTLTKCNFKAFPS